MNRFLPFCGLLVLCSAQTARAETIVIRPDPCPAGAEQPLIIDLGDVEAFTSDPGPALGRVLVIYPPATDGWASARILMRFDFDPAPPDPALRGCRAPRLFRAPR